MPQVRIRDAGGVLRTISRIRMRDATNTLRTIQRIRMRDAANVLRTVYQYLTVTLDNYTTWDSNSGAASSGGVTSITVTGTVAGGTAPFTYSWEYVSGDVAISPNTPAAVATTFGATVAEVSPVSAMFRLRVTDANGAVAVSDPVLVELAWFDTR